jgi:pimeloyl-ACP methyl ester carboxylesterase
MRPAFNIVASLVLGMVSAVSAIGPTHFEPPSENWVSVVAPAAMDSTRSLAPNRADELTISVPSRADDGELSLRRPYVRGKIPVVLIHGLGATADSWDTMIDQLEKTSAIHQHFQFWTFAYASGQPILYSASVLRSELQMARNRLDPGRTDQAFDHMVLIGYSMGGILAKVMVQDSQTTLWSQISDRPVEALAGPADARDALRESFFFKAVPEAHRVIFIATPHRGSQVDQGALHWLASRLNQPLERLRQFHSALVSANAADYFHDAFRAGLSSSVDQLVWEHPRLMALMKLPLKPGLRLHSIIADLDDPPGIGGSDGVVAYASAHIDHVASELVVHGGHLCLANPAVIAECERILKVNLDEFDQAHNLAKAPTGHTVGPISG